jgi:hypothetical protein
MAVSVALAAAPDTEENAAVLKELDALINPATPR